MRFGYVDTYVIARIALDEPNKIEGLESFTSLATSQLTQVELRRTLDRLRLTAKLSDPQLIEINKKVDIIRKAMSILNLTPSVLIRAGHPLPVALGTLDAIHLVTALIWQDTISKPVVVLTHDAQLAKAAQMMNLEVIGA